MFQYVSVGPFSQTLFLEQSVLIKKNSIRKQLKGPFFQQLAKSVKFSHHCNIAMNDIQQLKVEMNVQSNVSIKVLHSGHCWCLRVSILLLFAEVA